MSKLACMLVSRKFDEALDKWSFGTMVLVIYTSMFVAR